MARANIPLGELELAIMRCAWGHNGPVTVPEVHEHLSGSRDIAYTTTMTVMSRLHEKGLLERSETKRPYTYWPARSQDAFGADLMLGVLQELGERRAVLARFVDGIDAVDARTLRALLSRARRRRR